MVPLTRLLDDSLTTPEGYELFKHHEPLQTAVSQFLSAEVPERAIRVGSCIGCGRFSYVWRIGEVIIKISSPTSSTDSCALRRPLIAEPLTNQFHYLRALGQYLARRDPTIVTPQQYFALRSPYGAYLLCQQFMDGWKPIGQWIRNVMDQGWMFRDEADTDRTEVLALEAQVRARIKAAVADSRLRHGLTDLRLDGKRLHWGNVLVPASTVYGEVPRLCIIDQPGHGQQFWKQLELAIAQVKGLDSTKNAQ